MKRILSLLQAFLFVISSFSVLDSNFKRAVDWEALYMSGTPDFAFDTITAQELEISDEERALCRAWFEENILHAENPAYTFNVGGRKLQNHPEEWETTVGEESEVGAVRAGGKTTYVTLTHKNSGLVATVEATIYETYATCEWTVYIENTASKKSPVIRDFYGISATLPTGNSTLYCSKGSAPKPDDFTLYKSSISSIPMRFNANGGRSESFLPFFNICGEKCGVVLSVGWTGQWLTNLTQKNTGVVVKAKQEEFKAYLEAGETVRSPLVALSFYKVNNPLKGFNVLRSWETDCVCTPDVKPMNGYVIANEFSTKTTEDFLQELDKIDPQILADTDYFWMDAGWYKYNNSWSDGVGNWIPDANRFPDGLKPVADKMASMGKRFLLWYEPERVREDTYLYNEAMKHNTWIVKDGNDLLWNLGDDEACAFLSEYIGDSLVANGATMYRQDFNFYPMEYWRKADKNFYGGRKGICENHYVTNLYKYLDHLYESVDGLIIDNCASGGKRLDIEMNRRSIPLWRSDYNCGAEDGSVKPDVLEATQAMTYGLSCWMPYSGTNRYFHSEYASRTVIMTHQSVYEPDVKEYAKYDFCGEYMCGNYFPLSYGGLDLTKYLAMQFGDGAEGTVLIYKREKVTNDSYRLVLNGLDPEQEYDVYDIDTPETVYSMTGSALMKEGFSLTISETPKAVVLVYKAK